MRSLHSHSSFMVDSHHGIDTVLYTPDWPIRTCSFSSTREPPCSRTVLVLCKTRQQLEPWSRLDAIQCLTWTNQNPLGSGQQWPVSDSVSRYWPGTHICWHVGACVDGSLSISFTVLGKSSSRTSLTLLCWVVLSYMAQVNCSITLNAGYDMSWGTNAEDDAVVKPTVTFGSDFEVFHVDFFSLPLNWDVTSLPVKAWKKGSAWHLASPSSRHTELMW